MDREKILTSIRQHTMGLTSDDLLQRNELFAGLTPSPSQTTEDRIKSFSQMIESVGGECIDIRDTTHSAAEAYIRDNHYPNTDVEILRAHFGVAENGACWIVHHLDDDRTRYTLPEHIAIILSAEDIVPTMHEAYEQIAKIGIDDLGIFLSGPSKTADIEQSLVLGAQGAITTKVFLV